MNNETSNIQKELREGRPVITFTVGTSMQPLLYDKGRKHATHVLIEPLKRELVKGDMPIVELPDGRYMIHRVVDVINKDGAIYYRTRGDNCITEEINKKEAAFGVVTEIYRKGKTIKVTDRAYRFYVKGWLLTYPIRRQMRRLRIVLSKIKRKLI